MGRKTFYVLTKVETSQGQAESQNLHGRVFSSLKMANAAMRLDWRETRTRLELIGFAVHDECPEPDRLSVTAWLQADDGDEEFIWAIERVRIDQ